MKALLKTEKGVGNVNLLEVPEPDCSKDKVKVNVAFTGICGTDLHIFHDTFKSYPPVIMGHEFSGVVTDVGEEVENVKVGDRVAILGSHAVTCKTCYYCKTGYYMFCESRRGMGHGVDGSFTKQVIVREDMIYKVPESVSLEEAALSEPLACAVQAIEELTDIKLGDTVLLSGPGPIGLLCLSLLTLKGCKIIVAGTSQDLTRLEIAKQLGADIIVNINEVKLQDVVMKETKGRGVDVTIECAGVAASINSCLNALKKLGRHIQVGIAGKEVTLDYDTILYKQIQLFGSLAHSMKTWDRVMQILEQKKINLEPIITHKLPLSQWKEAFNMCEEKSCGKILLTYDN
ncbi:alcohol dehydrogenase catalytic domain-containing protein [Schinkia azotoformans]|uniref:Alcohol dehydrogenase GroES n=1 Tax=Schinkia azotoformans LMG 9581 TaxID=1131731 RepID=K6DR25_SCHAZ|nr:alcohol dehydrogenase catalytic domain-containing protein [Schinkia azotoformans]EKN63246.1 alcohol dehydrogenase GroES [Schinkia azotoformans LMG 9581]MEC1637204.1 alcohol dehydrogenase catalytic domain-containing protein [Schinkia azotoformans]MEC1720652.1 alcohol dehydrogenase catalytic domain-containing protein [Schinkia azotoformans]MEC1943608.1 alcohol dehydrogenase catalytic domain-containing protein [Schinkia azotoformans]MED4411791.1 alcohol dehydrogenase catalytic domain-containin